jgi:hypothetical protein
VGDRPALQPREGDNGPTRPDHAAARSEPRHRYPPGNIFKAGFDCTIPLVGRVDRLAYDAATASEPLAPPAKTRPMSQDELTQETQNILRVKPPMWKELPEHFAGQPYPIVSRAIGGILSSRVISLWVGTVVPLLGRGRLDRPLP